MSLTLWSVGKVLGSWLGKPAAKTAWTTIRGYFSPTRLVGAIEAALKSDPAVAEACSPLPTVDRSRFNEARVEELLRSAVSGDLTAFTQFLTNEQLIDLPPLPANRTYEVIWSCIANAAIGAIEQVVLKDEELFRQFSIYLEQAGQREVLVGLQSFRSETAASLGFVVEQLNDISGKVTELHSEERLSPDAQIRTINLLSEQNAELEQQLREQLDQKTEFLWNDVLDNIRKQNFRVAVAKGKELEQWLSTRVNKLSPAVRGRAYLFIAQTSLIAGAELHDPAEQVAVAKSLLERAREQFGAAVSEENRIRIATFQATLQAVEGRHVDALGALGTANDSQTVTIRLLIYVDSARFDEAASSIRSLPFDAKWCDHAALVFARLGEQADLEAALGWALEHGDELLQKRTRVACVRGTLMRLQDVHSDSSLSPLTISPTESGEVQRVLEILRPVVGVCKGNGVAADGIDVDALSLAYTCCRLIGNIQEGRQYISLVRSLRPVPLEYGRAVLRGDAETSDHLATDLKSDHLQSFAAHDLALFLDLSDGLSAEEALGQLETLMPLARTHGDKTAIARKLAQVAGFTSLPNRERGKRLLLQVVDPESRFVKLFDADIALSEGNLDLCEQLLSQVDDDPDSAAGCLLADLRVAQDRYGEAAELLEEIGRRSCEPSVLKKAARLAFSAKPRRLDVVLRSLENAVTLLPLDREINTNLAYAYVALQAFPSAIACFERLRQAEPSEQKHLSNVARCFVLANRPDDALAAYDELCRSNEPPLSVLMARAQLLSNLGQPEHAFQSLHSVREAYWADPDFVFSYMTLAYAANQEARAHEGFEQLWALRGSGKLPPNVLEPKTLEDLIEFGNEARERRELLQQQMIAGKIPWLFAERLLNNVPYWGWRTRTQEIEWHVDTPGNRATFSIYATNGYAVRATEDGRKTIETIKCAGAGDAVVIDLSALLTLHRLDLITKVCDYFGRVLIPVSYLTEVVGQAGRLQPTQLSQKTCLERIREKVDAGKICVESEAQPSSKVVIVDEYSDEARYRIRDILDALIGAGRLSGEQAERCLRLAHKDPLSATGAETLAVQHRLKVALTTLKVLAEQDLLTDVCATFAGTLISASELSELTHELCHYEMKAETRSWHEHLWRLIKDDPRIEAKPVLPSAHPAGHEEESETATEGQHITAIDAPLLAIQESLPLLADDRVAQMVVLNHQGMRGDAFGTDALLLRLMASGAIDRRGGTAAFMKLIKWRYRFLTVPVEILECVRLTHATHDLRTVARYVHDCMRDPGLFGGAEPTDPPVPFAWRFYQDWVRAIAEFAANVWLIEPYDQATASELTCWAMSEFLPTVPVVSGPARGHLASFTAFAVLAHAMTRLCFTENYDRANAALRCIAESLGLGADEFTRTASDVIGAYA